MKLRSLSFFAGVLFMLFGCGESSTRVERGFYYWKSEAKSLDSLEGAYLKELDVDRLYIKFFDVVPDDRIGNRPVAKTSLRIKGKEGPFQGMGPDELPEIVPTVFIRNEVLKGIAPAEVDSLASNIVHLCEKYYGERFPAYDGRSLEELQIDCDWTPSTRKAYFRFLKAIKKRRELTVSVTLRLYPFKYPDKMGVPPADRASLMCYNLYHPLKYPDKNSIQDPEELERYLKGAGNYPLPLDVVLPVFSRVHWYQNKRSVGTLDLAPEAIEPFTKELEPLWHEVKKDTVIQDHYLRQGDRLKVEKVSSKGLDRMTEVLKKHLSFKGRTHIAFYDLDRKDIQRYDHELLLRCYHAFSHTRN